MSQLKRNSRKVSRFALIGGMNTAIDFGILFALKAAGLPAIGANIISSTIAFLVSFAANRKYTFKSTGDNLKREFILFAIVTFFGLWVIQSLIIWLTDTALLQTSLDSNARLFIAKIIATLGSMTWNYFMYDRVVFTSQHHD